MDLLDLILNGENIRTGVILVAILCGFVWQSRSFDKKIDERFNGFHAMLKTNDFAHLSRTVREMTFILEKNHFLDAEDKKHIDARLDD